MSPKIPGSVRHLEAQIDKIAKNLGMPFVRVRRTVAHTIVGQMLPPGVVKGGTAVRLRVAEHEARLTEDVDFSPVAGLSEEDFQEVFGIRLEGGWGGVTGRLVKRPPAKPKDVPPAYVMQPYSVKLSYLGKPWCSVVFELGHDEAGSAEGDEARLSEDIETLFAELGLPRPDPIPVMAVEHQVAQKLHACTAPWEPPAVNDRAHDLVDLQILDRVEDIDAAKLNEAGERLFRYRRVHEWPPTVQVQEGWDTLYAAAAEGLDDLASSVEEAVEWANTLVARCTPAP
jgi:hypothetical protein